MGGAGILLRKNMRVMLDIAKQPNIRLNETI